MQWKTVCPAASPLPVARICFRRATTTAVVAWTQIRQAAETVHCQASAVSSLEARLHKTKPSALPTTNRQAYSAFTAWGLLSNGLLCCCLGHCIPWFPNAKEKCNKKNARSA